MPALDGAALIFDDPGIPRLTGGVQSPVQEVGLQAVGAGDAAVQAAGGLRAAVVRVLDGQGGEAVLGGVPGLPLVQKGLGLGLGGVELLLSGGGAGRSGADQNVAHIGGGGVVPGPAVKLDHIVVVCAALTAVQLGQGDVPALAGGVIQPVGIGGRGEGGAHGGGVDGGAVQRVGVLVGQGLSVLTVGQAALDRLGGGQSVGLGGLQGGGLLLVGHLHRVALFIGLLLHGGLDREDRVAEGVQVVGVLVIVGLGLLIGVGQAVLIVLPVGVGQHLVGVEGLEGILVHIAAVVQFQVAGQTVIGAAGAPGAVQGGQLALQIGLVLLGEGVALGLGGVDQDGDLGQVVDGLFQQIVPPGLAGLLVVDLLCGVRVVVKRSVVGISHDRAVVGVVEGRLIVILHHGRAVVLSVNGDSGGALLEEAAVPHQKGDGQYRNNAARDAIQDVLAAVLVLLTVIPALDIGGVRPGFLFSGCTHS